MKTMVIWVIWMCATEPYDTCGFAKTKFEAYEFLALFNNEHISVLVEQGRAKVAVV